MLPLLWGLREYWGAVGQPAPLLWGLREQWGAVGQPACPCYGVQGNSEGLEGSLGGLCIILREALCDGGAQKWGLTPGGALSTVVGNL